MLLAGGSRVAPCGNIGVPVLDAIRDPEGFDVLVVELSSYQLHWVNRNRGGELSPYSAACLNIADDHLDWHGSLEDYIAAKAKVYDNTQVACVYNRADLTTLRMVEEAEVVEGARAIGFGLDVPGPSDFGIVDGILCDRAFLEDRRNSAIELTTLDELAEAGSRPRRTSWRTSSPPARSRAPTGSSRRSSATCSRRSGSTPTASSWCVWRRVSAGSTTPRPPTRTRRTRRCVRTPPSCGSSAACSRASTSSSSWRRTPTAFAALC